MSALRSSSERSSARNAFALKAGVRLVQPEVDEVAFLDGLLVRVEEGRRLITALEYAERVAVDEGGRGGGEADHASIEILDHFGEAIEDRAVRFVEDDEVEKSGGESLVANAHRLLGRDVEALVRVDVGRANADARLVRKMRLEAVVERLLDERVAVGEKEHLLRPGALQEDIDKPHGGSGLAGAGRHDEQGAALAGLEGLGDAPDRFVLVGAFDDVLVDGRVFERLLVLADEVQSEQIVEREESGD